MLNRSLYQNGLPFVGKVLLALSQFSVTKLCAKWNEPTIYAGVAQLVEQMFCKHQVGGSNPSTSSTQPRWLPQAGTYGLAVGRGTPKPTRLWRLYKTYVFNRQLSMKQGFVLMDEVPMLLGCEIRNPVYRMVAKW